MLVDDLAPDFSLPDQEQNTYCLSERKNQWIVLYFYPKDNTPGCTLEGMQFSSLLSDFREKGAEVIGISRDSPASHCKFAKKHELSVRLLSDADGTVHRLYGAWGRKKMMGREFEGALRSTFLIGPDGRIRALWKKVKVVGHAQEVLNRLIQEVG